MMIKREGVVAQGERARPLPQPRLPRTGGSGTRTDAHPLPLFLCAIVYEEQGDPMRIADEQDKVRKREREQHMTTWSNELDGIRPEIQCW